MTTDAEMAAVRDRPITPFDMAKGTNVPRGSAAGMSPPRSAMRGGRMSMEQLSGHAATLRAEEAFVTGPALEEGVWQDTAIKSTA